MCVFFLHFARKMLLGKSFFCKQTKQGNFLQNCLVILNFNVIFFSSLFWNVSSSGQSMPKVTTCFLHIFILFKQFSIAKPSHAQFLRKHFTGLDFFFSRSRSRGQVTLGSQYWHIFREKIAARSDLLDLVREFIWIHWEEI